MKGTTHYPRILVVGSEPFNSTRATGITMSNMFRGWPKENIAQIYTDTLTPEKDVCENYRRLTLGQVRVIGHFHSLKSTVGRLRRLSSHATSPNANNTPTTTPNTSPARIDSPLRRFVRSWIHLLSYKLDRSFWDYVDNYKPDIVYSVLDTSAMMDVAVQIAKRYDIPVAMHFMDDWPDTRYVGQRHLALHRKVLLHRLNTLLKISPMRLAISDSMVRDYQERFGGVFHAFMNNVDMASIHQRTTPSAPENHLTLCYIGNVSHGRGALLKQIGLAAAHLNENEGFHIKMRMLVGKLGALESKDVYVPGVMILEESLRQDQIPTMPDFADACIHVDSFQQQFKDYFRLSLSTKIPLYMGWGLPILAYGPRDVNSIAYIEANGCGIVVAQEDSQALIDALRKLVVDQHGRNAIGQRGREVAILRHDSAHERQRLQSLFAQAG